MPLTRVTDNVVTEGTISPSKLSTGAPVWNNTGTLSAVGFVGDGSALTNIGVTATNETIFNTITSNYIDGYITADGFVGDGSGITTLFPPVSVIEVTTSPFFIESIHNNYTIILNSGTDIDINAPLGGLVPGHKTAFVQKGLGRGKFNTTTINIPVSGAFYTKAQNAKAFLIYGSHELADPELNTWTLYGDLTAEVIPQVVTYTLGSNLTSVNEGGLVTVNLNTTNVSDSNIPYTVIGTINSADLSGNSAGITGNFNLVNNFASIVFALSSDAVTEGTEFINLQLNNGQAAIAVQVNDTSVNASYSLTRAPLSSTYNEGDTVTVTLSTQGISNGTNVPYYVRTWGGNNLNAADFAVGSAALTGDFTINSNQDSKTFIFSNDGLTESDEVFYLALQNGGATINVTVLDTSNAVPKFDSFALGDVQTIALSGTDLYSAGGGIFGDGYALGLGLPTPINRSTFTKVISVWNNPLTNSYFLNPRFTKIFASPSTYQSTTFALSGTDLYSCGDNSFGQLGMGHDSTISVFGRVLSAFDKTQIPNKMVTGVKWTDIAAGERSVLGLSGTRLFVWGDNSFGQLGLGVATTQFNYPYDNTISYGAWPTPRNWTGVRANGNNSFAISGTDVFAGGQNQWGCLGLNHTVNTSISGGRYFVKVRFPIGAKWTDIASGIRHTLALSGTDLYSCGVGGCNGHGANAILASRSTFTKVTVPANAKWTAIAAGDDVSLALSGTDLYVCSSNTFISFGVTSNVTFTKIPGQWKTIPKQFASHMAVTGNDNKIYMVGKNAAGQLGLNNRTNQTSFRYLSSLGG